MLRKRIHMTTSDVSGRLYLASDPDVIAAVVRHVAGADQPEYDLTDEQAEKVRAALDQVETSGAMPDGVEAPTSASYIIVRPLTDGEQLATEADPPFAAQYGAIVLARVGQKAKGRGEDAVLAGLAGLPEKAEAAARSQLAFQAKVRERQVALALVEIDGCKGAAEVQQYLSELDLNARAAVVREAAAHITRITKGQQGKA
jgi:hypothetical protein